MKKTLLGMAFMTCSFMGFSQNLVLNPSFEEGAIPTEQGQVHLANHWTSHISNQFDNNILEVDLLDRDAASAIPLLSLQVPLNRWGELETQYGVNGQEEDDRYAHFFQRKESSISPHPDAWTREILKGTLEDPLEPGCYDFSFLAARTDWVISADAHQQIKVSLVSGSSGTGLEIMTTPIIVNAANGSLDWNEFSASVTIPANNTVVYDRILFEFVQYDNVPGEVIQHAFVDHVSLERKETDIVISGSNVFCSGQGTFLTVPTNDYTNYQWFSSTSSQPISNQHWISVNTGGIYTVEAWNDGDICHASSSIVVTEALLPSIDVPATVSFCNGNFAPLCGPMNTSVYSYTYAWYFNSGQNTSLISNDPCYTPDQYGNYQLEVTNQYGCTSIQNFEVVEGSGPEINIPNLYYGCKTKGPKTVGFPGALYNAASYAWTYNDGSGVIDLQQNGYEVPFQGDGEYCVSIIWEDADNPLVNGCPTVSCFEVMECCEPNPEYSSLEWDVETGSITVTNSAANAAYYSSEEYILYENCNNNGWVQVDQITSPVGTFLNTVVFNDLTEGCLYKVTHNVKSDCMGMIFSYTKPPGGLKISIYPNPAVLGNDVTIEMTSLSEAAIMEVYDMFTGKLIFTSSLKHGAPIEIENAVFPKSGAAGGFYQVKVYNSTENIFEKIIVR
ncbi:MAG: T9SS type A sorting domain-containing protein [Crocinitomicaceae bacterium]|nr:T9SS type A sorting domain-containing protein [Crocinitomicaceae bacterium]